MTRNNIIFLIILLSLLLLLPENGCHRKLQKSSEIPAIKEIKIDKELKSSESPDYIIENVTLTDSIIHIWVRYPGSRASFDFDLVFSGSYLKSLPPQANLLLKVNEGKKKGKKPTLKELLFNISKLKYPGQKSVLLKIKSYPERILYKY
ncbi:MAG: hypothetical protein KAX05_14290 [Bacteroidales bacterium]|nr:hypothetical protein [Bacteroidales bacterium]